MKSLKKTDGLLLIGAALFNVGVYYGAKLIARDLPHHDLTLPWDEAIPVVPWMILIYFGAYLFWAVNYYLSAKYERNGSRRFLVSHFIGETVCFLVFVLYPTTMQRPDVTGASFFDDLLRLTYQVDSPNNLIPSIHCFASWLCWIGVRRNPHIPRWYRHVSLLIAAAICISTLTVKQHVIVDAAAGILLAELSYLTAGWITVGRGKRTEPAQKRT